MSISDTTENAILNLIFSATLFANYAINATASPEGNIAVGLHTADPADAGTMATSEIAYTSYARIVNIVRSTGFTTASGTIGSISPAANIDFAAGTGGSGTANFFSTGKASTGGTGTAAPILWSGGVAPPIVTGNGVTPRLTTASTITLD